MPSIHPGSLEPESPQTEKTKQRTFWQTYSKWVLLFCALVLIIVSIAAAVFFLTRNDNTDDVMNATKTESEDEFMNTTHPFTENSPTTEEIENQTSVPEAKVTERRKYHHRLPRSVIPTKYNLLFRSNIPSKGLKLKNGKKHTFEGMLEIELEIKEETSEIQLHAVNLNFRKVYITSSGEQVTVKSFNRSEIYPDRIIFELAIPIRKGSNTTLRLQYSGFIGRSSSNPEGYFYGNLRDEKNIFYTATMNEPAGARLMVPCFDEPSLKAVWVVTMEYPQGYTALANQKQINVKKMTDGFEQATFLPTPPMSSYLLALSVNQHMRFCKTAHRNTQICLFTVDGNITKGNEIVDVAVKTLNFLEDFTTIPYSLEKLDILESEVYFEGALECWGLITAHIRSTQLSTIVHEIAHQWFGNLATTDNWGDIWLNEGTTTYMECLIMDKLETDNSFENSKGIYIVSENIQHPIVFKYDADSPILNKGKFGEIAFFDPIVYEKAASALKLFADAYTEEWTKELLKKYMLNFKKKNSITEDFLDIVESMSINSTYEVAPLEYLNDWLYQTGYPILLVFQLNETHISVDQTALVGNRTDLFGNTWNVPVFYQIDQKTEMEWLHKNGSLVIEIPINATITLDPTNVAPYYMLYADNVKTNFKRHENFEDKICNRIVKTASNKYFCQGRILPRKTITRDSTENTNNSTAKTIQLTFDSEDILE